jgi:hypothetical protein
VPRVSAAAAELDQKLRAHMKAEEDVLYRLADEYLDAEERASLLDFCRAME